MYSDKDLKDYLDAAMSKDEYVSDYKRLLKECIKRKFLYKGKPIPFEYQPLLISDKDEEAFRRIAKETMSIVKKVTKKYVEEESYRKLFNYGDFVEKLILHDPGYSMPVPMSRFDIFYNGYEDFGFCEINTDGTSAMLEDYAIASLLLESKIFEDLNWNFSRYELFDTWVKKIISLYKDIKGIMPKNVLIADFNDTGTPDEFLMFKDHFEKNGIKCIIEDISNLDYDREKNKLIADGEEIDLVYRRVVMSDLMRRRDDSAAFIEAYLNDAAVYVGSFRSQVVHNKVFFSVVHMDETKKILTEEENEFVKKHIPFTARFEGDEQFFEKIVKNKDKYIFKPTDLNAARGVYTGRSMSEEEFIKTAKENFNTDYIYQEFVTPKELPYLKIDGDKFSLTKRRNMIGLFCYMEEFSGVYARMGLHDIIGSAMEYVAAPGIKYKR